MISTSSRTLYLVSLLASSSLRQITAQQPTPPVAPAFEVASIRPSAPGPTARTAGSPSPGTFAVAGLQLRHLISLAYGVRPNQILGGPNWIDSQAYDIVAKPGGTVSESQLSLMLQELLGDRFKLKIHRETREVKVYALTVAKGGDKLQRVPEASCAPRGRFLTPTQPEPNQKPPCGVGGFSRGTTVVGKISSVSLDEFSKTLSTRLDRFVINRTGLTGVFDIHVEFAPDGATPGLLPRGGAPSADGLSIFAAFQEQLGLKLEPTKGPAEFLVIDIAEKPSEN
jgi:uncharacterized protein (TIGR03435 family)